MLQAASRSTENARETMKPEVIKRSIPFRARHTCSSSRRIGPRLPVKKMKENEANRSKTVKFNPGVPPRKEDSESRINEDVTTKVLDENSASKIHSETRRVLDESEGSLHSWQWIVDDVPKKSIAMTKFRNLCQERADVFIQLRSSFENMLDAVRHMKNQRSR